MRTLSLLFLFGTLLSACALPKGLWIKSSNATSREVTEEDVYCGADLGATLTEGDYVLRTAFDKLPLGQLTLVTGKPHDGLRSFSANGFPLYQLNQYASCNSESVRMFRGDNDGVIYEVLFEKNGEILKEVLTDSLGTIKEEDGLFSFCPYDNTTGMVLCDSYRFESGDFIYVSTKRLSLEEYQN